MSSHQQSGKSDKASFGQGYHGEAADAYDRRRFTSPSGLAIQDVEMGIFQQALDRVAPSSRVLEVGCGTGRFLLVAAHRGMNCAGADLSGEMLEQTRAKLSAAGLRARLHESPAQRLPFEDGEFDFVYSIRALNQMGTVANAEAAIREMVRVCRPGGQVLVEFVNAFRRGLSRESRSVYLWPSRVRECARMAGAEPVRLRGAFLFGMTAILRTPRTMLPTIVALDQALSRLVPHACARCYASLEKPAKSA